MNRKAACLHRWCFAHVAAQTDRIRLGTAIITLPMENPLRVAEDAAVLDLLTDGRLEVGFGSGGTPTSFLPFGLTSEQRGAAFADHLHLIHSARGDTLSHPDNRLYPPAPQLAERIWIATFSAEGAIRAGQAGHGLMLSRTQPRPPGEPRLPLDAIQNPIIDAYLSALPDGVAPRIRLAHRLRRRQSRPRPAGRRARSAQAGDSAPGGGSYDRR